MDIKNKNKNKKVQPTWTDVTIRGRKSHHYREATLEGVLARVNSTPHKHIWQAKHIAYPPLREESKISFQDFKLYVWLTQVKP